ncbi:MAG: peptidase, partial [Deltaproteobacteria bacterium]
AWVSSNGVIGFGSAATSTYSNVCLPTTTGPSNALFVFWDDLATGVNGVCVGTLGVAPNRLQVITWSDVHNLVDSTSSLTFSAMLNETTNEIDVVYRTLTSGTGTGATGTSATIGVQNQGGTAATQHSCNTASLMSGATIHYTPM